MRKDILLAAVAVVLVAGITPQVHANQLDALLLPDTDTSSVHLTAYKTIQLAYPQNSEIAKLLEGKNERIEFTKNSSAQDVRAVIEKINKAILNGRKSPFAFENATLHYTATVKGFDDLLLASYTVDIKGYATGYVLLKEQANRSAIVDVDWRNFAVAGPLVIETQWGEIDINSPTSAMQITIPELAGKLAASEAREIVQDPIIDFGRFGLAMQSWHFLFDVTGEQLKNYVVFLPGEGRTVSIYSIGESSFREGTYKPEEKRAAVTIDGTEIEVLSSTPPPSGQITIAGYSKVEEKDGIEVVFVSSKGSAGFGIGFQFQVLLVLGGMMGAIAVFVLFKSRR